MPKKTFVDEVYGKVTYDEDQFQYKLKEDIIFTINGKEQAVKGYVDVPYIIFENIELGLEDPEMVEFYKSHPNLVEPDEARALKKAQKEMFQNYIVEGKEQTVRNIEEAALKKLAEILADGTEKDITRAVGQEKAQRLFAAKAREEKLASLQLKKLKVLNDTIEITCTCDWYKPSGGFIVFIEDGSVEMVFVDCMSI